MHAALWSTSVRKDITKTGEPQKRDAVACLRLQSMEFIFLV